MELAIDEEREDEGDVEVVTVEKREAEVQRDVDVK